MVQVIWSARAQRNVIEIEDFIAGDKPMTAERLAGRLKDAAARLSDHPDRGRLTRTGIRELTHVHPYVCPSFRLLLARWLCAPSPTQLAWIQHVA